MPDCRLLSRTTALAWHSYSLTCSHILKLGCQRQSRQAPVVDDTSADSDKADNGYILVYSKTDDSKVKNRRLPCFYCGEFVLQMNCHLLQKHGEETLVTAVSVSTTHNVT